MVLIPCHVFCFVLFLPGVYKINMPCPFVTLLEELGDTREMRVFKRSGKFIYSSILLATQLFDHSRGMITKATFSGQIHALLAEEF